MIKPPKNKRKLASWRSYYRWLTRPAKYVVTQIGDETKPWVLTRVNK